MCMEKKWHMKYKKNTIMIEKKYVWCKNALETTGEV